MESDEEEGEKSNPSTKYWRNGGLVIAGRDRIYAG